MAKSVATNNKYLKYVPGSCPGLSNEVCLAIVTEVDVSDCCCVEFTQSLGDGMFLDVLILVVSFSESTTFESVYLNNSP